ncbi:MAG: MgtC/SapB family protein, partial [Undibacterium sp.]|nr:MgtC/SapB family protein [Undibacterium sp.]
MNIMDAFTAYWSNAELSTNLLICLNILGALLLGLLVGYERSYHGRAAGMRTYGLVCMSSAALTVLSGYPGFWFGGHAGPAAVVDPTRVIQGIVTGIGFLGAGVIMKDGFNISGLTTAAYLWAAAVIGILIGVGFYAAGMLLAASSAVCMVWITKLESWLPSRHAVAVMIRFRKNFSPHIDAIRKFTYERGYQFAGGSVWITYDDGQPQWHFVIVALSKNSGMPLTNLSIDLTAFEGVEKFHLS